MTMGAKSGGKDKTRTYILLNVLLFVYSFSMVLSKLAAGEEFLSVPFCLFYAGEIFLLGVYAIFWQQLIKKLPISAAYANKAVTVVWGIMWGAMLFGEGVTIWKIVGALLIIGGIVLFSFADEKFEEVSGDKKSGGAK